jgi:mono/diheme cytochrome c family protein
MGNAVIIEIIQRGLMLISRRRKIIQIALVTCFLSAAPVAEAQRITPQPQMFPEQGGEAIYKGICQGCHMPDAKGGVGAGMYPALANNSKLAVAGYPVSVVTNGQKAMPAFIGSKLSDQQVADVVNYIRTHFGNHYSDAVTAGDVKAARP